MSKDTFSHIHDSPVALPVESPALPTVQLALVDDIAPYVVQRPDAGRLLEDLCVRYQVSEDTMLNWLSDLVKEFKA